MDVVLGLVDRVAVMHHGSLLALDSPGGRDGGPHRAKRLPRRTRMSTAAEHRATEVPPILRVEGLNATIAGQQVVEDVSFTVPATGITALLGRNGVGKTSTIKAIIGLIDRAGPGGTGRRADREGSHVQDHSQRRGLRPGGPRGLLQAHRRGEPPARRT